MRASIRLLLKANTVEQLVTDEELERAWGNANFGDMSKREVLRLGTLKCLAGWHQGYTSKTICTELGLIDSQYRVTAKGRAYIWLACQQLAQRAAVLLEALEEIAAGERVVERDGHSTVENDPTIDYPSIAIAALAAHRALLPSAEPVKCDEYDPLMDRAFKGADGGGSQ